MITVVYVAVSSVGLYTCTVLVVFLLKGFKERYNTSHSCKNYKCNGIKQNS